MRSLARQALRWESGLLLLLALVLIVGQASTGELLSSYNLQTTALNNIVLLFLALAVTPVIITGDIDISIAGTLSLCGVFTARLWTSGVEIWVAVLLALVLGAVCGLVNGILVVAFDLPALAVTLGTMGAYTGASFLILQGNAITNFPSALVALGSGNLTGTPIPISVVVVAAVALGLTYVVHFTKNGKSLFAIGGSRRAALFSGIPVNRVRVTSFVIAGLLSAVAAIFYLGNYDTAQAGIASDQLLPAITAVILGGVSAYGGTGTVPGVAVAAVLLAFLQAALGLHGLSGEGQTIAVGILLVVAIGGGEGIRAIGAARRRSTMARTLQPEAARPTGGS